MSDRRAVLDSMVERCRRAEGVEDAWVAKNFTDLLLVVEVQDSEAVHADLVVALEAHDLVGYNEVHGVSATDPATAGTVADRERYWFVDLAARGTQQSYVVE
jgi:hypothetical protein